MRYAPACFRRSRAGGLRGPARPAMLSRSPLLPFAVRPNASRRNRPGAARRIDSASCGMVPLAGRQWTSGRPAFTRRACAGRTRAYGPAADIAKACFCACGTAPGHSRASSAARPKPALEPSHERRRRARRAGQTREKYLRKAAKRQRFFNRPQGMPRRWGPYE